MKPRKKPGDEFTKEGKKFMLREVVS